MKPWWKSKTVWVAVVTGLLGTANYLSGTVEDTQVLSGIVLAQAMIMAVLRWLTGEPIGK